MNLKDHIIVVVGLGYVGLPLAAEFGKKRPVIGYDISSQRISELMSGHDRTLEVSKDELLQAQYLTFTDNLSSLRLSNKAPYFNCGVIFIVTVPTPVDSANRPDFSPLINATRAISLLLKPFDVVIYESTVFPGATEEICVPILEGDSGLKFNHDFFVAYSPERINPGDKTHRLPDIKKITSGSTPETACAVDELYNEIIIAGTHKAASIKVAEAAKVIENVQRDLNIAFVNELSVIFARMGIDTHDVLAAASTKWNFLPFKPGLVGGHCIGVDPYYLTHKAQELGYRPQVILSGRAINDNMGRYAARNVIRLMLMNGIDVTKSTIGVLGITFKENCCDVRNSKVIDIIRELTQWGANVAAMDPHADPKEVFDMYQIKLTEITANKPVDSIVVAVAHDVFSNMLPMDFRILCSNQLKPVIADLKSLYDRKAFKELGFTVFRF
jgi:UDP-N-acetyl-D-galactosamine dehydrogenase